LLKNFSEQRDSKREGEMRRFSWALGALVCAGTSMACAQETAVQRAAKGPTDKDIRIGVYVSIKPDCSSGPLPTIRLATPPANGKVTVKRATVNATNYKQCLALQVPAFVALYRANPEFVGSDLLSIEVRYPGGRTEIQQITVNVSAAAQSI
jgi:hypothetical protein